jgi:small subunit ribosomal protein S9
MTHSKVIDGRNYGTGKRKNAIARFAALSKQGQFDVEVNVAGGGVSSQAEAVRHGIARALVGMDEDNKPVLKKAGYITRDARKKERKKPGQPGARKKFQYSKR